MRAHTLTQAHARSRCGDIAFLTSLSVLYSLFRQCYTLTEQTYSEREDLAIFLFNNSCRVVFFLVKEVIGFLMMKTSPKVVCVIFPFMCGVCSPLRYKYTDTTDTKAG